MNRDGKQKNQNEYRNQSPVRKAKQKHMKKR